MCRLGDCMLRPSTATATPACGGGTDVLGRATTRLTTTPEPPVASIVVA